ncbi:nucleolar MIF4G domain-containing protein 1 [Tachyglossus aculeatus]|uniref:nucleolar MIF4G domain-containing protein 1 n=1 Tax=Tachyglossus aculeatus TaxID=9261 RepID=UPI0018F74502|nr:nucleolar MIF4G domain-containing protein 1 [Tachyglossus aculeatus]
MKRPAGRRAGPLKRLRLAVEELVRAAQPGSPGGAPARTPRAPRRRGAGSRKELRRQKRRARKGRWGPTTERERGAAVPSGKGRAGASPRESAPKGAGETDEESVPKGKGRAGASPWESAPKGAGETDGETVPKGKGRAGASPWESAPKGAGETVPKGKGRARASPWESAPKGAGETVPKGKDRAGASPWESAPKGAGETTVPKGKGRAGTSPWESVPKGAGEIDKETVPKGKSWAGASPWEAAPKGAGETDGETVPKRKGWARAFPRESAPKGAGETDGETVPKRKGRAGASPWESAPKGAGETVPKGKGRAGASPWESAPKGAGETDGETVPKGKGRAGASPWESAPNGAGGTDGETVPKRKGRAGASPWEAAPKGEGETYEECVPKGKGRAGASPWESAPKGAGETVPKGKGWARASPWESASKGAGETCGETVPKGKGRARASPRGSVPKRAGETSEEAVPKRKGWAGASPWESAPNGAGDTDGETVPKRKGRARASPWESAPKGAGETDEESVPKGSGRTGASPRKSVPKGSGRAGASPRESEPKGSGAASGETVPKGKGQAGAAPQDSVPKGSGRTGAAPRESAPKRSGRAGSDGDGAPVAKKGKGKSRAQPAGTRGAPGAEAQAAARRRALLAANEAEEREIRHLERRLGLRRRRKKGQGRALDSLPPGFARDGLGYVLGALGLGLPGDMPSKGDDSEEDPLLSEEDEDDDDDHHREEEPEEHLPAEISEEDPLLSEEEEDEDEPEEHLPAEDSENSSAEEEDAPCRVAGESVTKYIPPHVRRSEETVDARKREELERLKKNVKGLINRLSEPNIASISGQLEELYMANSRKDMNDTLTGVLMNACVTEALMPARLVMEHVLLVSILHHTVGIEVGAHFLEAVVRKFDEVYKNGSEGKECDNAFALIAHLYSFHVVHSLLIFDILKKLIATFTEKDIELILLLLKNVGFALRKDDALALKELISEAQARANGVGNKFHDQTRVRFMIETMLALKNNDMRKIPGYDPEPIEKLRKLQRTLVRNSGSGKETQLRVSWEGLLNAEQIGRWWIVGSSWSGAPMIANNNPSNQQKQHVGTVSSKILELARKQRMNTDVRRSIFCTLMVSEDFLDAFEKLLRLGLKDQQEREIVHVLIDCCLQEKKYNPFYAFLAGKFCNYDRKFQMTFQFTMWDKFRDLENLTASTISNLVHLLVHLLKTKSLPLSIFKVIEFSELNKQKVDFLRKILYKLLMETEVEELSSIFTKMYDNPKLGMLSEGLKLFINHFLLKNAQAHKSAEEATALKEKADLVLRPSRGQKHYLAAF